MLAAQSIPLSAMELSAAVRAGQPHDLARLDRVLRVDGERGAVEVQAGACWTDIAARLRPGHARTGTLGSAMRTVGESLGANAAGPDGRPAVTHVQSLTLVMPNGELVRASRTRHGELFALTIGGYGVIGVLYSVTLDIGSLCAALDEAVGPQVLTAGGPAPARRPLRLLVPPHEVGALLEEARALCDEWRMPLAAASLRRTREENETFLRWARREYAALSLRFDEPQVLGAAVRATQLRRALLDAAIARGGSFALHCTPEATRAQIESCYPELPRFLAEKRRVDPTERLSNAWYLHYRRLFRGERLSVRFAT